MVSVNLHLFGFWLVSSNKPDALPSLGMTTSEIEGLMRRALNTLKLVGGTSIMSRKAHRCLQRYLDSFTIGKLCTFSIRIENPTYNALIDRVALNQMGVEPLATMETAGPWRYELPANDLAAGAGMWDTSMEDLMAGLEPDDFLGADLFVMSYNISDFDATGFI